MEKLRKELTALKCENLEREAKIAAEGCWDRWEEL